MSGGKKRLNKNQLFKRQKVRDARTIRSEAVSVDTKKKNGSAGNDLSDNGGMLKINDFIGSREFEIRQLQLAMRNAKMASCTRVFQSLPRKLRRRTASHNVKRIPKRMRNRALREMLKSDQTGSKGKPGFVDNKRKRNHGLTASQLYKAKMSVKLLRLAGRCTSMRLSLPPDVTAPNCNLRQKIKCLREEIASNRRGEMANSLMYNNVMGSYDNTGMEGLAPAPKCRVKYWKRQRFFTWLPTHIWNAKRSHMIKRWGFQIPWSPTQKCYKLAHRLGSDVSASDGALCMDSSFYGTMTLKDTSNRDSTRLKEIVSKMTNKRATANKYRVSKTWFEGLMYDISEDSPKILGEMDLLWIDLNLVLIRIHPSLYASVFEKLSGLLNDDILIEDCRYSLGSLTIKGAKSLMALSSILRSCDKSASYQQFKMISKISEAENLPHRTMFAFECIDPRHLSRPRPVQPTDLKGTPTTDDIISLQSDFPEPEVSKVLQKLADSNARENSYQNQQTSKQLAARRRMLLSQGPAHVHKNMIPYNAEEDPAIPLLIVRRRQNQDWVLILPWFWVLPFWYQLNRVSRVYHFGLRQQQQLSFESRRLYFPDDYPFTEIGYMENSYKRDVLKAKWQKKPPAKRLNFVKITNLHKESIPAFEGEIGNHFSCDWKLLQLLRRGLAYLEKDGEPCKLYDKARTSQFLSNGVRDIQTLNDIFELYKDILSLNQNETSDCEPLPIKLVNKQNSELERTSSDDPTPLSLSERPLPVIAISCTFVERGRPKDNARIYEIPSQDQEHWEHFKTGIYRADGKLDHEIEHPAPQIINLIGFITSGAFHLGEGRGVAHGFIDANKQSEKYVLVRNVGTTNYRLAKLSHTDT